LIDEALASCSVDTIDVNMEVELNEEDEKTDKCVGTFQQTTEKGVGNHICTKSVRTQYSRIDCGIAELLKPPPQLPVLTVKIPKPSRTRSKATNTSLSFSPYSTVKYVVSEKATDELTTEEEDNYGLCEKDPLNTTLEDEWENSQESEVSDKEEYTDVSDDEKCTFEQNSPSMEPKYLVFWSCLVTLFRFCFTCFAPLKIKNVRIRGSLLTVFTTCANNHKYTWRSQPIANGYGAGNLLLAGSILFSGNTFTSVSEMFKILKVAIFTETAFSNIQRKILFPTINKVYKSYRDVLLLECTSNDLNNFVGDGRCDSPVFSAKYGTYSLVSTELNRIVDFYIVHVGNVENSGRMEKLGLETLLKKFYSLGINFNTLTTDRHIQIRSMMKKEYPEIDHQFDIWHFGKSIKKRISQAAKRRDCSELGPWIKSIVNHLWWCCASCEGDEQLLLEKWKSIIFHI